MANERSKYRAVQRGLGTFGLTLIVLLGWAAEQTLRAGRNPAVLGQKWLGAATITLITIVGKIVDSLPLECVASIEGPAQPETQVRLAQPPRPQ
jgi:hypothetical protein